MVPYPCRKDSLSQGQANNKFYLNQSLVCQSSQIRSSRIFRLSVISHSIFPNLSFVDNLTFDLPEYVQSRSCAVVLLARPEKEERLTPLFLNLKTMLPSVSPIWISLSWQLGILVWISITWHTGLILGIRYFLMMTQPPNKMFLTSAIV